MVDKENLLQELKNGVVEVTFTKKDGSVRVMKSSLKEEYLKSLQKDNETSEKPSEKVRRKPANNQICVIDVDKNAWRSFDIETVTGTKLVEIVNENVKDIDADENDKEVL